MFRSDKEFIRQYLETALWSSLDDDTPMDDNYSIEDIDLDTIKLAVKDCLKFIELAENEDLLDDIDYSQAGHDFWLTRCGHGAGFWGRGNGAIGDRLTELCEQFGNIDLYITDSNKVAC